MLLKRHFVWDDIDKSISFVDQTLLPIEEKLNRYTNYRKLAEAIENLRVRGAPAIGIAGAYGVAIASFHEKTETITQLRTKLLEAIDILSKTRPTAVNLFWALERIKNIVENKNINKVDEMRKAILVEAKRIDDEEYELGLQLGRVGIEVVPDNCVAITHCNAGGLATGGMGSALSVLYFAKETGKNIKVFVDETRPLLQGGRLTTYELKQWKIDYELICDNMAGLVMKSKGVNFIITGCDRVAVNGDAANKIGTYSLSILAKYHNIPFYIAAPLSTIDFSIETGEQIPIEERNQMEITQFRGIKIAPDDTPTYNPAFDVVPNSLITGFITEEGIIKPPFKSTISRLKKIWEKRKI